MPLSRTYRSNACEVASGWLLALPRFGQSVVGVELAGVAWTGWQRRSRRKNLPLHWSTNENVAWRVPLPDRGNSTPIVWRKWIFLTQAIGSRSGRTVMCFDRRNGQLLWQSGVTWTEKEPTSPKSALHAFARDGWAARHRLVRLGGLCTTSPGMSCGTSTWQKQWGYAPHRFSTTICASSISDRGTGASSLRWTRTGRTVWKYDIPVVASTVDRQELGGPDPSVGAGRRDSKLSEIAGSWATPLIVPANGHDELVVALPLRLMAFAPRTGERLWNCDGPNIGAYGSPFHGEGLVAYAGSGFRNNLMVVRPGGRGDVTKTHRLWLQPLANSQTHLGAGAIFHGYIYLVNNAGIAKCSDLRSGDTLWKERLPGTGGSGASWSSPVLAGDRLYVPNRNADVFV